MSFSKTKSHGLVSLPFLGLIEYHLEKNNHLLIKNATTELYANLSYSTLSGARDFRFEAVSDLTSKILFLLKKYTLKNLKQREIEQLATSQRLINDRLFTPKTEDPLDTVIEIMDGPNVQHKKTMFPYEPPQPQTADEIETMQQLIDDDFIDFQSKYNEVNDVATKQKQQKKVNETVDDMIDEKNPFNSFDEFWWEDDLFIKRDSKETVEVLKNMLDEIKEMSNNILENIEPIDYRNLQELIDDDFIEIDNRTYQQLADDDFIELQSPMPNTEEVAGNDSDIEEIAAWDPNNVTITDNKPRIKLSVDFNQKVKAANKIKKKYRKKTIGKLNSGNNVSRKWLKNAGYLDTKDQDSINYMFVLPKDVRQNEIPHDAGHFIRTEIESTDFKKSNLASKMLSDKKQ